MDNIRQACERSGMTLTELGEGLGYAGPTARKGVYIARLIRAFRPCSSSPKLWMSGWAIE